MPQQVIVQIIHGMQEYSGRYREFRDFLAKQGLASEAQDLMGHGPQALVQGDLGYFPEDWFHLVQEQIDFLQQLKRENPEAKIILLGHSMGSFAARTLAAQTGQLLSGLIIMGTAQMPSFLPKIGYGLAQAIVTVLGKRYKSSLLRQLALGSYNKAFQPEETGVEWLSRDISIQKKYLADPLCNFLPTASMFQGIFQGLAYVSAEKNIQKIPPRLPLLLVSGAEDPVGERGQAVEKLYAKLQKLGHRDVELKLYPGMRHEILNEIGKEEVYQDLVQWIQKVCA
ncbi:MAG: alpha/beta fold hydrolase [Eubacteriales bacterium]|nr:alpha/beta fold hydrolase [Eubacteriales bacterium]